MTKNNKESQVISSFGSEWSIFNQENLSLEYQKKIFDEYFHIFPWEKLPIKSVVLDAGCGSGRWANLASKLCYKLIGVDASYEALEIAKNNNRDNKNVEIKFSNIYSLPFKNGYFDAVYSLGVLHHMHQPEKGLGEISRVLKKEGIFLGYLYYSFENRSSIYKVTWFVSDFLRLIISTLPRNSKMLFVNFLAAFIYYPLAKISKIFGSLGIDTSSWILNYYSNKNFYSMRNDCYDRFCTKIEKRFSKKDIKSLLEENGLEIISFSESMPCWTFVAKKK